MRLVIGICGKSAVGKSTVAKIIASRLEGSLRSCGEIVKNRMQLLGVAELSAAEHRLIDSETRELASSTMGVLIIEGRYLDEVLKDLPQVVLVEILCADEERAKRAQHRDQSNGEALIRINDTESVKMRENHYEIHPSFPASRIVVDSSSLNVEETVSEIFRRCQID